MKTFFETIAVAFGMFSRVPVPNFEWNDRNRRYAMLAFPLIGVALGACWLGAILLFQWLGLPALLGGALLTGLPFLITGGIHLDGYLDTRDALSSHAPKEKKLEIMSDPHTGAFAVLYGAVYLILWFAASTVLLEHGSFWFWFLTAIGFVLSRSLSGLAVATFPMAKDTGLVKSFADEADKKKVTVWLVVYLILLTAALVLIDFAAGTRLAGIEIFAAAVFLFSWYRYIALKHFGGITGDLAGWFLSRVELWALVVTALIAVS